MHFHLFTCFSVIDRQPLKGGTFRESHFIKYDLTKWKFRLVLPCQLPTIHADHTGAADPLNK